MLASYYYSRHDLRVGRRQFFGKCRMMKTWWICLITTLTPGLADAASWGIAGNNGLTSSQALTLRNALQATGGTMTGTLNVPQVNLSQNGITYSWNANHGWNGGGSSAVNSAWFMSPYEYGTTNGDADVFHLAYSDGVSVPGTLSGVRLYDRVTSFASGARNAVLGSVEQADVPDTVDTYVGTVGHTQADSGMPTPQQYGWPIAITGAAPISGGMEAGWFINAFSGIHSIAGSYGIEVDDIYDGSAQVGSNIGVAIVDQGAANNGWHGLPGVYVNSALPILGGTGRGFDCGLCLGSAVGDPGISPYGTLIGGQRRLYGGSNVLNIKRILDGRQITTSAAAIETPGFAVDPSGNINAASVSTAGIVQAQTAYLSGVTINYPGIYSSWPTLIVQAPPGGGPTATATVQSLAASTVLGFGQTGMGYTNGDVLTATGGTASYVLPGSNSTTVSTQPSFTCTTDGSGHITALTINNPGAMPPGLANGPTALAGGSGTGAMALIHWTSNSTSPVLRFSADAAIPASTGGNYAIGDTITVVGDTGTAAQFKVTAVTATGGLLMTGLTLTTTGNVTAIAPGPFHTLTSSGKGAGGTLSIGYGITGIQTSETGNYVTGTTPLIDTSGTDYRRADLDAQMSSKTSPMILNPGGKVCLDKACNQWVQEINNKTVIGTGSVNLFSIDTSGNVIARGNIVGNGSP